MSTTNLPVDRSIHGTYEALPDLISDWFFSVIRALTAYVWTVRDRIRLFEDALSDKGIALVEIIESSRSTREAGSDACRPRSVRRAGFRRAQQQGRRRDATRDHR